MFQRLGNYKIFLLSESLIALSLGLFNPFWILFLQNFGGGIQTFGFLVGLMVLTSAVTSYFAGRHSDKLGRKPFLLVAGLSLAVVMYAYTLIQSIQQLYILQLATGVVNAMQITMVTAFLGDITKRKSRGLHIGTYHALIGVITALALMASGFVANDTATIFKISASIAFVGTLFLFGIEENR